MNRIFYFALTILCTNLYAQTIKDFYVPAESLNRSTFFAPDPQTGKNSGMETKIWYIKKGVNYDIMEAKLFNGQATSIVTETVSLSTNEVKLIKSITTSQFVTNKQKTWSPTQTILKLPAESQKESWSYTTLAGEKISCTAQLMDLRVKGELKKAIRVTNEIYENGTLVDWGTTVEFYVMGIGLYKIETAKGELLDILSGQTYDKDVDKL